MEKPYQKNIDFLQTELDYHKYILKKYSSKQEYDKVIAERFQQICRQISAAISALEERQDKAVSEWSALSPSKHRAILLPVFEVIESTIETIKENGCPEFANYLDHFLTYFLIDLQDFTDK